MAYLKSVVVPAASMDSRVVIPPRMAVDPPDSRIVIVSPRIVEISSDHVLSRVLPHTPKLNIDGYEFSSIDQAFYSCCLAQHNMFIEATEFWACSDNCDPERPQADINLQPSIIRNKIEGYFANRGVVMSAKWLFSATKVMRRILTALAYADNAFSRGFHYYKTHCDFYHETIRFVAVTNSGAERLWTSGHRPNELPENLDFRGTDLYGELVTEVYQRWCQNLDDDFPSVDDLLNKHLMLGGCGYTKTALILSDSTFRQALSVEGGEIWYQTGYTCGDLANAVRSKYGNLMTFKFVIVAAGTNDATRYKNDYECEESWASMRELLSPLRNHPYIRVLFNTGIGVPNWPDVPQYADWFKGVFKRDFGRCENFQLFDWSIPNETNCFLHGDRSPKVWNLDDDECHPNVAGIRSMWRILGQYENTGYLRQIRFTSTVEKYALQQLSRIDFLG